MRKIPKTTSRIKYEKNETQESQQSKKKKKLKAKIEKSPTVDLDTTEKGHFDFSWFKLFYDPKTMGNISESKIKNEVK